MGLKACTECGKEISDSAVACPHCGHKPYKPSGCFTVIMAGIVILVVGNVLTSLFPPPPPPPKTQTQIENEERQGALGACRLFIEKTLHDPDSAEFLSGGYAERGKNGTWTVQRTLRAKNAFGAMRLATMECTLNKIGSDWHIADIKQLDL